jgi:copper(I)-binding protein
MSRSLPVMLLLLALATMAGARASDSGLRVEAAWARASAGAASTAAAYATIVNAGTAGDRLVAISCPLAGLAQLHVSVVEGTVASMRPVSAVDLGPGDRIELRPGGLHVMLTGLQHPLRKGDRFPLAFIFERGGRIETQVEVLGPGARGPQG